MLLLAGETHDQPSGRHIQPRNGPRFFATLLLGNARALLAAGVSYMAKIPSISLPGIHSTNHASDPACWPQARRRRGREHVVGRGVSVDYGLQLPRGWRKHRCAQVHVVVGLDAAEAVLAWQENGHWETRTVPGCHGWMVPAGVMHRTKWLGRGHTIELTIEPRYVLEVCETDVKEVAILDLSLIERLDLLVWRLTKAFGELCHHPKPASPLFVESIGAVLAAQLLKAQLCGSHERLSRRAGLSVERLRRVMEYIESHLGDDLSRETLAAVAKLSLGHFSRMFKISTSRSPHEYVMQRRQMYARELMREGRMKKSAVAVEAGFSDQTHLGRHLKKVGRVSGSHGASGHHGELTPP